MELGWSCHKHNQSPIVLVCTGNVWHFQGLCTSCVPDHTKNHPKNIKIQMESLSQVLEKAKQIKKKVSKIYQIRMEQCQNLKNIDQDQFSYIKMLREKKNQVIEQISITFDKLIEDTRKFREQQEKNKNQELLKLITSLQEGIKFFQKEDYSNIEQFCRQIKKYYFKQNFDVYVDQYDEVIRQYRQKVVNYNPILWSKEIKNKCTSFIKNLYRIQEPNDKRQIKERVETTKKQAKKKEFQKKKCGKCGHEMQYLTQWKKHLVCRNCGGKQRNYIKK